MAEKPVTPQFTDSEMDDYFPPRPLVRAKPSETTFVPPRQSVIPENKRRSRLSGLDIPLLVVVALLLAIGAMMVYSTTFYWSVEDFGNETTMLLQHMRNMAIGGVMLILLALIDYRIWKRFAFMILIVTIASLIAVYFFSDEVFGARRALLGGSYQPGELAELTIVIYLAALFSSKRVKVDSFMQGLLPFVVVVGVICFLVMLQPDLSTAATIAAVGVVVFFLAGANLTYLFGGGAILGIVGVFLAQNLEYATDRISGFAASLSDLVDSSYHTQQAIIAFRNGEWFGVGLGQGRQKFGFLPAPHTDSIFASIGEELGVLGAAFVVALFVVFAIRGLKIARQSNDTFGMLLASGISLWIIIKAMFNIAVMLSLVPPTGVALPFISYGGSSLFTVLAGIGLLLSVGRVNAMNRVAEGRNPRANFNRGWGNGGARVPSAGSRRTDPPATP